MESLFSFSACIGTMAHPEQPFKKFCSGRHLARCVRKSICFERATAFSLPLLLEKGGEGRGEEALFINFPSLRLSPRSFLSGTERQNAASVLRAEHNRRPACRWDCATTEPPTFIEAYSDRRTGRSRLAAST